MVALTSALEGVSRLFLDTAPVVYYIEQNPTYWALVGVIFDRIEAGAMMAVTSPITLAECLIHPYRLGLDTLQDAFVSVITEAEGTLFQPIDAAVAQRAAMLRATYNLTLTDALQIAAALAANSDAFLTNDLTLKRVTDLRIVVLADLSTD
jgi:predicted nucleic acid-binding protein